MWRRQLRAIASVIAVLLLWANSSVAYELETHRRITQTAFRQSLLDRGYLEEEVKLSPTSLLKGLRAQDWLEEGSVREDDTNIFSLQPLRFRNHFYDPANDRGLTHPLISGFRAFEWALEEPAEITGQEFSWRDARRYFLTGLTGTAPGDRENAMALTFRTLGQVMHLVQDMGSPEHARNDLHAGVCLPSFFPDPIRCPFGEPSLFERFIDTNRNAFSFGSSGNRVGSWVVCHCAIRIVGALLAAPVFG